MCVSKFPPLLDRYPHPASHPLPTALLSGDWAELEVDTREQGDNAPTPKGKKEKAYVWLSYLRRWVGVFVRVSLCLCYVWRWRCVG